MQLRGLLSLALWLGLACSAALELKAPAALPPEVSNPIDQQWLGWAVESSALAKYASTFSLNIFRDFRSRAGGHTIFRVGGTSMDHSSMNLSQVEDVTKPEGGGSLRVPIVFGQEWFEAFEKYEDTRFIIQAPMAERNKHDAVTFVKECISRMGVENLHAVQLGNEPDLYVHQDVREDPYPPGKFAQETANYIQAIEMRIPELPEGRIFQVFEKASDMSDKTPRWHEANRFVNALDEATDINRVKSVGFHYYQAQAPAKIEDELLNPQHTQDMFNQWFGESHKYLDSQHPYLEFVIDEIGSALGNNKAPDDGGELQRSLGTSVWTVDFMLNAMAHNTRRINMQLGHHFHIAAWQPDHVQGTIYGAALVADFIGHGGQGTDTETQVLKLPAISKSNNGKITVYAGYSSSSSSSSGDSSKLCKLVVTNQAMWSSFDDSSSSRGSQHLIIELEGEKTLSSVLARRVTAPGGGTGTVDNITYAGLDWDGEGNPYNVVKDSLEEEGGGNVTIPVVDGKIDFRVPATEAWLITW